MKTKTLLFLLFISTFHLYAENFSAVNKGKIIFYNITSAANLTLEVTYKGTDYDASLNEYSTAVVIPDSIEHLGKTYVVTTIGENAFRNCERLSSVTVPASVISIEKNAFSNCKGLNSVTLPASLGIIKQEAFSGCSGLLAFTLPTAIKVITEKTFSGCSKLKNVLIPASVNMIEVQAFAGCAIDTLFIPASVDYIDESSFIGCKNLMALNVDTLNKRFASIDGLLFDKSITELLRCGEGNIKVAIPDSVSKIGSYAFYGCDKLVSINLPDSTKSIRSYAFSECTQLSTFTIPSTVLYLEFGAFMGCSGLISITIPTSITTIGERTFYNCKTLPEITIPSTVKEIGKQAFYGCVKMANVYVDQATPAICDENSFDSRNTYGSTLHVPTGASLLYKGAIGWRVFYNVREDVHIAR